MKKLFALLLILASSHMFGQVIVHNQPVKLKQLVLGTNADSLVVVDGTGLTKHLPISSIQISPEVAIVAENEGNGLTYFPQGQDRTYMGVGGQGALNFSFADNLSTFGLLNGGIGNQSITFGYNVQNEGFAAFMMGEDGRVTSTGTYGYNLGYGSVVGGYNSFSVGTYNTTSANYSSTIGHTNRLTSGGGSVAIGRGLQDTTPLSDALILIGEANAEPEDVNGFTNNNIGGMIGAGVMTGAGSTPFVRTSPFNVLTWFRDADAGVIQLDTTSISLINTKKATFPRMIPTVEWVESVAAGGGNISGSIGLNQVAYGSGVDAIQGSANFTYDGNEVATDSLTVNNGVKLGYASQTGLGKGAIWRNGLPWIFATADNEAFSQNIFFGEHAGENYALHGTGTEPNDGGNVGLGAWAMNQMGENAYQNTAVGTWSLEYMTTGDWNTGVGAGAMYSNTTGGSNTGVGRNVASAFTTGSNNSFFGKNAGLFYTGNVNLTTVNKGVFIGADTKSLANNSDNEIVIGYGATGKGNNTATIGNGTITKISSGADYDIANDEDLITWGSANHLFDAMNDFTRNKFDGNWTLGAGWSSGDDTLIGSAASGDADLNLTPSFLVGDIVKVIVNVSSYTSGNLFIGVEGTNSSVVINAVGKYELIIDPVTSTHNDLKITTSTDFTGTISQFKAIGYQSNQLLNGVTDVTVTGFNNPISVGGGEVKTLSYDRDVPIILGSTAQTPTADNFTGVMFVNNSASTLALTVDGSYSAPLGFQFSANKFGTGDITLTPTNGATINGSTGVVTITTRYEGTVQLIHISGDDYLMVGKL